MTLRRVLIASVLAAAAMGVLAGCASQTLTPLAARDRVVAIPGVASDTVTTGIDQQTLDSTHYTDVRAQLTADLASARLSRIVDSVAAIARATDIGRRPTYMLLTVAAAQPIDTVAALHDLGVDAVPASQDRSTALISARAMDAEWGRWPAPVPEARDSARRGRATGSAITATENNTSEGWG